MFCFFGWKKSKIDHTKHEEVLENTIVLFVCNSYFFRNKELKYESLCNFVDVETVKERCKFPSNIQTLSCKGNRTWTFLLQTHILFLFVAVASLVGNTMLVVCRVPPERGSASFLLSSNPRIELIQWRSTFIHDTIRIESWRGTNFGLAEYISRITFSVNDNRCHKRKWRNEVAIFFNKVSSKRDQQLVGNSKDSVSLSGVTPWSSLAHWLQPSTMPWYAGFFAKFFSIVSTLLKGGLYRKSSLHPMGKRLLHHWKLLEPKSTKGCKYMRLRHQIKTTHPISPIPNCNTDAAGNSLACPNDGPIIFLLLLKLLLCDRKCHSDIKLSNCDFYSEVRKVL